MNFGGSQNCPDLSDREEAHIAAIWATNDRSKMGRYDGRKMVQVIFSQILMDGDALLDLIERPRNELVLAIEQL